MFNLKIIKIGSDEIKEQISIPTIGIDFIKKNKRYEVFINNPLATANPFFTYLAIDVDKNKVIGSFDIFKGILSYQNIKTESYWGSTYYVDEEYRKEGIAIKLILEVMQNHFPIFGCNVAKSALPIYKAFKWINFQFSRFIVPLKSDSVVKKYIKCKFINIPMIAFLNLVLNIYRKIILPGLLFSINNNNIKAIRYKEFPDKLSYLLEVNTEKFNFYKNSKYINFVINNGIEDNHEGQKKLFLLFVDDECVGYFIIKIKFYDQASHRGFMNVKIATLIDYRMFDESKLSSSILLKKALIEMLKENVDILEMFSFNNQTNNFLNKIIGFRMDTLNLNFYIPKSHYLYKNKDIQKLSNWIITPGEGDNIF